MKLIFLSLSILFFCGTSHSQHHMQMEQEPDISLELISPTSIDTEHIKIEFNLNSKKEGVAINDSDLTMSHEKKLHFLVYDESLNEFQHVHPTYNGNNWSVELKFNRSGNYRLWAQGELINGDEFSVSNKLNVSILSPSWPTPAALTDTRDGVDGISSVRLETKKVKAKKMAMLKVKLTRTDGTQPSIQPYLGAFAHVVSVSSDANSLIHVHPQDTNVANEGILHVTFAKTGTYRLWVQFIDDGLIRTVPLAIEAF